ncbi:hypothetical protein NQZ68_031472 [Dissostichus eleginoides]|nr:hypothetical protein NQZ68_031472 [Dissostichus eleginoides]
MAAPMLAASRLHSLPLLCFGGTITVGSIGTVELSLYPASPSTRGNLVYNLLLPPNLESKTEGKASRSGACPRHQHPTYPRLPLPNDNSLNDNSQNSPVWLQCLGVRIEGRGALEIDHRAGFYACFGEEEEEEKEPEEFPDFPKTEARDAGIQEMETGEEIKLSWAAVVANKDQRCKTKEKKVEEEVKDPEEVSDLKTEAGEEVLLKEKSRKEKKQERKRVKALKVTPMGINVKEMDNLANKGQSCETSEEEEEEKEVEEFPDLPNTEAGEVGLQKMESGEEKKRSWAAVLKDQSCRIKEKKVEEDVKDPEEVSDLKKTEAEEEVLQKEEEVKDPKEVSDLKKTEAEEEVLQKEEEVKDPEEVSDPKKTEAEEEVLLKEEEVKDPEEVSDVKQTPVEGRNLIAKAQKVRH